MLEHRVEKLYINSQEEGEYRQYIEANLKKILRDPTLDTGEKSETLYYSAKGLVKDIMESPRTGDPVKRTVDYVEHSIDFLLNETGAFSHLLQLTSFDYYTYTHSVNVFVFSVSLAQRIGYEEAMIRRLGIGALLHDVGKCDIDPDILNLIRDCKRREGGAK